MNREDFPMLNKGIIYFDNGATTLKPQVMIDKVVEYYTEYSANAHRGDYDISLKVDMEYENTRDLVMELINASKREEIIFTSGCTESLNVVVNGFFKDYLKTNDEVLICQSEHASNVVPWYILSKEVGIKVKNVELDDKYELTVENVKNAINSNTKVISIAHVTNVIGDERPLKEIIKIAHDLGILVVVDGAQSVPHMEVDVKVLDCDFLTFSAHKMCGPTGVGVLYGKYELLNKVKPLKYGGGMNESFEDSDNVLLKELPTRLEAGTPNIAGVIGFGAAITYLNTIGFGFISKRDKELKEYLVNELNKIEHIEIINPLVSGSIVAFNVRDIFSQDVACYLNKYGICVRAGNHCAKNLVNDTGVNTTCRISLYFYNTFEEIDEVVKLLSDRNKILEEMF